MKKFACSEKNFTLATSEVLSHCQMACQLLTMKFHADPPSMQLIFCDEWWLMTDPWTLCLCMVHQIFHSHSHSHCHSPMYKEVRECLDQMEIFVLLPESDRKLVSCFISTVSQRHPRHRVGKYKLDKLISNNLLTLWSLLKFCDRK